MEENQVQRKRSKDEIRRALQEARGAWGRGKTLEEIDSEIAARRTEDWPSGGMESLSGRKQPRQRRKAL